MNINNNFFIFFSSIRNIIIIKKKNHLTILKFSQQRISLKSFYFQLSFDFFFLPILNDQHTISSFQIPFINSKFNRVFFSSLIVKIFLFFPRFQLVSDDRIILTEDPSLFKELKREEIVHPWILTTNIVSTIRME